MKTKTLILLTMTLSLLCQPFQITAYSDTTMKNTEVTGIFVNGQPIPCMHESKMVNGIIMLPIKSIVTALGCPVDAQHLQWTNTTRSINVLIDKHRFSFQDGNSIGVFDNINMQLEAAPFIHSGKLYVPIRGIAQILEKYVIWDPDAKCLYISDYTFSDASKEVLYAVSDSASEINTIESSTDIVLVRTIPNEPSQIIKSSLKLANNFTKKTSKLQFLTSYNGINREICQVRIGTTLYTKESDGKWQTETLNELLSLVGAYHNSGYNDFNRYAMYAGMAVDNSNPGKIVLSGPVLPRTYAVLFDDYNNIQLTNLFTTITVDRNTHQIDKVVASVMGKELRHDGSEINFTLNYSCLFTSINKPVEIVSPIDTKQ